MALVGVGVGGGGGGGRHTHTHTHLFKVAEKESILFSTTIKLRPWHF